MYLKFKLDQQNSWQIWTTFCLYASMLLWSELASATTAASSDAISGVLCAIVQKFNGPIGRGIATIAIIVLGIGLFLGKLSWPVAVATAIGIGLIFGAGQMVTWISAAGGNAATSTAAGCTT